MIFFRFNLFLGTTYLTVQNIAKLRLSGALPLVTLLTRSVVILNFNQAIVKEMYLMRVVISSKSNHASSAISVCIRIFCLYNFEF